MSRAKGDGVTATVSINGKVLGNLDDLVRQPTQEFKDAFRGLAERAMGYVEPQPAVIPATQLGFDYSLIDEGIRDEVKEAARSIHQLGKAMQTSLIAIGKRLIEAKGMLPEGQFSAWIEAEFQLSQRSAQNFMNVARVYGDRGHEIISPLSDTVLYMLAAPSTPEAARVEVEQAAIEGKKVTVEFAKATVQKHKPESVKYAPVWELESKINAWLTSSIGEVDPDAVMDALKLQSADPNMRGGWLSPLCQSLVEVEIAWRKSDLAQAINNVREQRRVAERQAQARKVYVEPEPERVSDDVLHARQDQLLTAIVDTIGNRGQVVSEVITAPEPKQPKPWGKTSYAPGPPYDGWMINILPSGEAQAINENTGQQTTVCATTQQVYGQLRQLVKDIPATQQAADDGPVYTEPTPAPVVELHDSIVRELVMSNTGSDIFKAALKAATIEQLDAAMRRINVNADKGRYLKVGNRRELLLTAQQASQVFARKGDHTTGSAATPAPKLSTIERINRDLDAYDAEARREHAQLLSPTAGAAPSEPTGGLAAIEGLAAKLRKIATDLAEGDQMLDDLAEGREGWYHDTVLAYVPSDTDPILLAAAAKVVQGERTRAVADDEAEAIALVAAETAREDEERVARDAQRPSYERVPEPEPVVAPATDSLDRLKRASLLRYMLIQARDAARRDYFDLVGLDVVVSRYARAVDEMLPPLDSFIRCLEGKE